LARCGPLPGKTRRPTPEWRRRSLRRTGFGRLAMAKIALFTALNDEIT
jgi:hypothetical protein